MSSSPNGSSAGISPDFIPNLISNLAVALITVIAGIPAGLYVNRRLSARQSADTLKAAMASIRLELQDNQRELKAILNRLETLGAPPVPMIRSSNWLISQTPWQAAGFPRFELYRSLSEIYERLHFVRRLADTLWGMYFGPIRETDKDYFAQAEQILTASIRDEAKDIVTEIDAILLQIEEISNRK
jgi:hypothetical protein